MPGNAPKSKLGLSGASISRSAGPRSAPIGYPSTVRRMGLFRGCAECIRDEDYMAARNARIVAKAVPLWEVPAASGQVPPPPMGRKASVRLARQIAQQVMADCRRSLPT